MAGKLYGLGVGPGDPELLTLKSLRILKEVDLICTPVSGLDKQSLALEIVQEVVNCQGRVREIIFPMTYNRKELKEARERAVDEVVALLKGGKDIAFITLGDPLLYSTYIYVLERLRKEYPELEIETVPGITAINAATARINLPLATGEEGFAVLPALPESGELESIFRNFKNIVILKASKDYDRLVNYLEQSGLKESSYFISRCGQEGELITADLDSLRGKEIDYLSLLIVKEGRYEGLFHRGRSGRSRVVNN